MQDKSGGEHEDVHGADAGRDAELAARLRVAVGRLHRMLRQDPEHPLTLAELSALVSIEAYGPLRLGALAQREGVAPSTLTRVLATLESDGLISRTTDPADARSALVTLSERGRERLDQLRRQRTAVLQKRLGQLAPGERESIRAAITALERLAADTG